MPRIRRRKDAGETPPAGPPKAAGSAARQRSRPATAGGDTLGAHLFVRGLGLVYVAAFLSLGWQIHGLIGPRGVFPFAAYLAAAKAQLGAAACLKVPTLLWLWPSDDMLDVVWLLGLAAGLLILGGRLVAPSLALAWLAYLSLTVVGRDFLAFQWDNLLLEAGLLAIFLLPPRLRLDLGAGSPLRLPLWLLRFLLFRLMLGSGLVKLLSGDPSWRSLRALEVHYETQPLPTFLGFFAHQLPAWAQRASTLAMFAIELAVPFLIFAPPRLRRLAFWPLAALQLAIAATGNYGFFNLLTVVLCFLLLDDAAFPRRLARLARPAAARGAERLFEWSFWPLGAVLGLLALMVFAASLARSRIDWPAPLIRLYRAADSFRAVGSYGLFAVMTQERHELFIDGSRDGREWREYRFSFKPEDPGRFPPVMAPHLPRLDWLMWFAALGEPEDRFFRSLMASLARGDKGTLELFAHNPFPDGPPQFFRVRRERWRFTDRATRERSGAWWSRQDEGFFLPPTSAEKLLGWGS